MSNKIVLLFFAAMVVIYVPWTIRNMKKAKKTAGDFEAQNPTAARVILMGVVTGTITVNSVNEEPPVFFQDGVRHGFFLLPGENVVNVEYSWTRPGIVHKTVTNVIGPENIKLAAEPGKTYHLEYNKKEERYEFTEV